MLSKFTKRSQLTALYAAAIMTMSLSACHAEPQSSAPVSVKSADSEIVVDSGPDLEFRGTISGDVLDFKDGKGEDTPAVKQFKKTGKNPYNGNDAVARNGYTIFSTACSGCHGHLAEGKLGPALHDDYWTYPGNMYDKGFFETIYGGGQGMMGPQKGMISQDEILQIMSWIRSVYDGDPKKAKWKK
jgi:cytochrome c-L